MKKNIRINFVFAVCLSLFLPAVPAYAFNELDSLFAGQTLSFAVLKSGTNSLNKRLGDLRRTKEEVNSAFWVRGYYNELSRYGGIDLDAAISGMEAGIDFRVLKDSPNRVYAGVMAGYIGAENFQTYSNIKSGAPLIGLYETWLSPAGWFIDATARYFFYNTQDVLSGQKADRGMFAASVETGREFKFPAKASNFFMLEPKIKGTFGHISGATVGYFQYEAAYVFIARPAVFAGYSATLKNGAIVEPYIEGGYSQDFSSDMKISGYPPYGMSGGSFDIGGGFNAIVTKILSIYTYAGYEKGDKIENLSVNAGVRIALTRFKKDGKSKETETASSGTESADDLKKADLSGNKDNNASQEASKESEAELEEVIVINYKIEDAVSAHPAHFGFDQYAVTPENEHYLKSIAEKIKKSGKNYETGGHTDRIGSPEYNQALSERRAKAVYDKLIEFGVPANKLTYKGFGFTRPINAADTEEADAENRRVEIKVTE
ncbi:MAG: autotransporter outer membrane beta-barrel domain-containing protein [Endomicrobia bacterium]|nr:autotransporter outer membrane beta-barrel domain-containing protein [Endomicrobiia bacterium]